MFNSSQEKTQLITIITHKEVQILYNLTRGGAIQRLNKIRASLGKKLCHNLTVIDFCKAEDITLEDFDLLMKRAK